MRHKVWSVQDVITRTQPPGVPLWVLAHPEAVAQLPLEDIAAWVGHGLIRIPSRDESEAFEEARAEAMAKPTRRDEGASMAARSIREDAGERTQPGNLLRAVWLHMQGINIDGASREADDEAGTMENWARLCRMMGAWAAEEPEP